MKVQNIIFTYLLAVSNFGPPQFSNRCCQSEAIFPGNFYNSPVMFIATSPKELIPSPQIHSTGSSHVDYKIFDTR
jgi:hypothetical protein